MLVTLEKNMKRAQNKKKKPEPKALDVTAGGFDIICKLRKQKNGEKFCKLFDEGDFSDYGSQSEADLALCSMIAFRVGDDPDAIGQIFRQSALYREKWEREDYREDTLAKGIEACNGV